MRKDCIEIKGKSYRVEFDWNAIANFLENEGLSLEQADDLRNLRPRQITGLIHAGIKEGCSLEKIDFPYTKEELGAMLQPVDVGDLIMIYARQTSSKQLKVVKKK